MTSYAQKTSGVDDFALSYARSSSSLVNSQLTVTDSDSDYDTDIEVDINSSTAKIPFDCGETQYLKTCNALNIVPSQRILNGLKGHELQLRYRGIGVSGATALASALTQNTKVEILDLEENALGEQGCVHIADMLKDNLFLTRVSLAKNNAGSAGARAIGEMMAINNCITHLDLSENHFKDSDAEYLALGIKCNKNISDLNLSHNEFLEDGAQILSKALGANCGIECVDLSWNHLRCKGAAAIGQAIRRSVSIITANLAWNGLGFEGAVAMGDMLRKNKLLRELDISNNRINWEGATLIARGLKENSCLEILRIGYNPLTMTGCLDIIESTDALSSAISYIGFDGIPVNRRIIYTMEKIQKQRIFTLVHGGLLESEDVFGRRLVLRCDPLKLLIQFLNEKGIRPVDLFRTFDKDNKNRVPREQFVQGLKKAKVPLDDYEIDRVLNRLDSAMEGKISYQRLMHGVRQQIKVNREEEKKRQYEDIKKKEERRRIMKQASTLPQITEGALVHSKSSVVISSLRHRYGSAASSVRSVSTNPATIPYSLPVCDPCGNWSRTSILSKETNLGSCSSGEEWTCKITPRARTTPKQSQCKVKLS